MTNYPDLSQPVNNAYPDLSQPISAGDNAAPQGFFSQLNEKYQDFMNPNKVDQYGHPTVETFLGRMPDPRYPENMRDMQPKVPTQEDMTKAAGILTMFMAPEAKLAEMLPAAAAKYLPKVGSVARTLGDAASNIFKTGAGVYAGSKMLGSDEHGAQKAGLEGSEIAFGLTPLTMMFGSLNPYARILAGAGLGAFTGAGANAITGDKVPTPIAEGGGAVMGALLGGRGQGLNQLAALKAFGNATPEQLAAMNNRLAASKSLGIDMNALEALGTPTAQKQLESLGTTPYSSMLMAQRSNARLPQEQGAINNLLDNISPQNAYAQFEEPLYRQATSAEIAPKNLAELYKDPYLKGKIDSVLADPINSDALQNVSPTSIKMLDLVKRKIDAERFSPNIDKYEAARLKEKSNKLVSIADEASPKLQQDFAGYKAGTPIYQVARDVSEKRQARQSIVDSINESEMSGSNFYDTWLRDDKKFKQLRYHLRDRENPDVTTSAQAKLDAMRESFPYLIDPLGKKAAQQLGNEKMNLPHSITSGIGQMFNNLLLSRYNKALADLIWKPNWDAELAQISKMKSGEDRGIALGRLLSRIGATGNATYQQMNQQGSNDYATGQ